MRVTKAALLGRAGVGAVVIAGALTLGGSGAFAYGPTPPADGNQSGAPAALVPSQEPVASSLTTGSSGLAFTGADVAVTTAAGAAAIGLGGGVLLLSRRRRRGLPVG